MVIMGLTADISYSDPANAPMKLWRKHCDNSAELGFQTLRAFLCIATGIRVWKSRSHFPIDGLKTELLAGSSSYRNGSTRPSP